MTNKKLFQRFLIAIPLIVLSACTVPGQVNQDEIVASVKGTLASELTLEANVAETLAVVLAPTTAPTQPAPPTEAPTPPVPTQPTLTMAPTVAPAATQALPPTVVPTMVSTTAKVSVSVNTNCRLGPAIQYPILCGLLVDEEAEIVGRLRNNSYWLIKNPDATGECWITGAYATPVGPYTQVPVKTAPPWPGVPVTNPNYPYGLGKITLSSAQAVKGDSLTVKVIDFPANSSIDIRVGEINKDATLVFDGKVAANGTASHTFTVPNEADKGETWVVLVLTTDLANGTQASLPFYIAN